MSPKRNLFIVAAVVAFIVVAGYLVSRSTGGGGQPRTIDLTVTGSTLTPAMPTAKQGDRVTMSVTADQAEEIHLHGYEIKFGIPKAGATATQTFVANKSGSFEIEIEDSATHLGQFRVSP